MRRPIVLVLVMFVVAACSGGAGEETTEDPGGPTTQAPGSDGGEAEDTGTTAPTGGSSDDDGSGGDDSGSNTSAGLLTITGETYRFADTGFPGMQCEPSAFGVAFLAALRQVDETGAELDGGLSVGIPFPGEEETAGTLPEVTANVGEMEWVADPEHAELNGIAAGSSQIDSYEIDGNTVTGTGTFYEENSSFGDGDLMVEQGTFEVTCAG